MQRPLLFVSLSLVSFSSVSTLAQDCPIELELAGQADIDDGSYADVWADGDIAFVGQFHDNKVHFFDISNPAQPDRYLEWVVQAPNSFASAQDVKSADGLLFIALEGDGNDGVEIVDIRDPYDPKHLSWISTPGYADVHNVFYDEGYLYLADSRDPTVGIVDLTNYDPDNPPTRITENLWFIDVGTSFVHDITVKDGRLYASAWNSGIWVYDITDLQGAGPVLRGTATGTSSHAAWPSDNGRWVVVGEERTGGPVRLYEMIPQLGGGLDVTLRNTYNVSPTQANSAHNVIVIGNRVYVSWYQAGLIILDINEEQKILEFVGQYDTSVTQPFGFSGAWGVYPFLGEDRLLISDMQEGLNVISAGQVLLSLEYPDGLVETVDPQAGATLTIRIDPSCDQPDPNSITLFYETISESGGTFTPVSVPFDQVSPDTFEAQIPGSPCGTFVSYYVEAGTMSGETVVDPPDAPQNTYFAEVISGIETFFEDTFVADEGWTVSADDCASIENEIGGWERVEPIGTSSAPDGDFGGDAGSLAFVTAQGESGGGAGQADVDGGPFYLTSPTIAIDHHDVVFSFASWVSWNGIGTEDKLLVAISGDAGESWQPIASISSGGPEWFEREYRLSEFAEPSATLNVRFSIDDCPNDSITEAAIDNFKVQVIDCFDADTVPPVIRHDAGPEIIRPHSGYIDPRIESTDGVNFDLGIDRIILEFSEPVQAIGGGTLTADDFRIETTGLTPPAIAFVEPSDNPAIVINLESPLPPGSWFTLIADVEDLAGNRITDMGNMGPAMDEPDRIDLAALPGDVDQNGRISPIDLFRFRTVVQGLVVPEQGTLMDYVDTDRSGTITPLDLFTYRRIVLGLGQTTQAWASASLDANRP